MKMKMPFDGFYLKLLDEQNGSHEYEEYLRNCKENPLTEEEQGMDRKRPCSDCRAGTDKRRAGAHQTGSRGGGNIRAPDARSPPSCRKGAVPDRRQRTHQR